MKRASVLASVVCALLPSLASAERIVQEISWSSLKAEGRLASGTILPAGGGAAFESLRVTNPDGAPRAIPLFEIARPGVKTPRYLLRGDVRGEGVEGQAYLEMWSFFAGGGRYFSRTLAEAGPMASLHGSFAFRPFLLPFTAEPGMTLEKVAVNVALPGRGTVVLGPLRLVELAAGDDFVATSGAWLSPREIARVGAIGGTLLGLLGAVVGILASRARARGVAVGLLWSMLVLGVAALAAAAAAWKSGQPAEVQSLLLLVGALATALPAGLLGKVKRQYEEKELRRMKAVDAV